MNDRAIQKHPLFAEANKEVDETIPNELRWSTIFRLSDVRDLMILAFIRGATYQREHSQH